MNLKMTLAVKHPIKYWGGDESYVKILGMPHGVLFMLYLVLALLHKDDYQWDRRDLLIVFLASVIPFGTFYVDKKYLR